MKPQTSQAERRAFLRASAIGVAGALAGDSLAIDGKQKPVEAIDAHTHFYDPTRKEGVPWPGKQDKLLYRRVLPDEFVRLAGKHNVTGTIVVEASPWVEDNQWLLALASRQKVIRGVVGRLDPASDKFPDLLKRFAKNAIFRGIRIGHAELKKGLEQRRFLDHLAMLGDSDRQLDINGGPDMPADVARLAKKLPKLRIVINHAANLTIDGKAVPKEWLAGMKQAGDGKNVTCKVSALVEGTRRDKGDAPEDVKFYRPVLDALWDVFGSDRLIYGSNWPVSERFASYSAMFSIVSAYFAAKGEQAREKFFRRNAEAAYKLTKRD